MTGVLIKRRNLDTGTDTHRGKMMWRNTRKIPCKDGGRDWNYASISQEISGANKLEKARKALSCTGVRGSVAGQHLDFPLLASRTMRRFLFFQATQFVELYYSSPRKLTQVPTKCHANKRDTNPCTQREYILVQSSANYVHHSFTCCL